MLNFTRQNVVKKKSKEDSKIQNLTIETKYMWNLKPKHIPVVLRTTERISNYIRKYPSKYPTVNPVTSQRCPVSFKTANRLLNGRSAVRIPAGTRGFPHLQNVHTNPGVHPAAYSMGTVVPFLGVMRLRPKAHRLPPSSSKVKVRI